MKLTKKDILTIPNLLSMLRLLMIPIFVWLYQHGHAEWTAGVLILSGLTDIVDGYIARHFNQVSDFGKAFDPLADKLLVMAALVCLVELGDAAAWMVVLILAREFAVTGLRQVAVEQGIVIAAAPTGKIKTITFYNVLIGEEKNNIEINF